MEDILKFNTFNDLKKVYRNNSVDERKESTAEHTWSSLMLADYFLEIEDLVIDRLKIYELIMYHDIIEIETGDIPVSPEIDIAYKKLIENNAIAPLKKRLPTPLGEKFVNLFNEFEENKTLEAKFSNAVDKFDAIIHQLNNKEDWKLWTKEFLIEAKEKHFLQFPSIHNKFKEVVKYLEKEKYFEQ